MERSANSAQERRDVEVVVVVTEAEVVVVLAEDVGHVAGLALRRSASPPAAASGAAGLPRSS